VKRSFVLVAVLFTAACSAQSTTSAQTISRTVDPTREVSAGTSLGVASTACAAVSAPRPNPNWANKAPIQSGRVDYPFPFTPGVVQIVHSPGCDMQALLRAFGLGPATHNLAGPFTDFDRAAGLDRSYRVQVAPGTEVATVLRLAPHTAEFPYVGLFWIAPITLD
jgi:hypothetical protein